jgi:hypothetical protein
MSQLSLTEFCRHYISQNIRNGISYLHYISQEGGLAWVWVSDQARRDFRSLAGRPLRNCQSRFCGPVNPQLPLAAVFSLYQIHRTINMEWLSNSYLILAIKILLPMKSEQGNLKPSLHFECRACWLELLLFAILNRKKRLAEAHMGCLSCRH